MGNSNSNWNALANRLLVAFIFGLLVLGTGPGSAAAGSKRLVIQKIRGPSAAAFYRDVLLVLEQRHNLVSNDRYDKYARQLGATRVNARNVRRVAQKLGLDGVIFGKVRRRGGKYLLTLTLRAGVDGQIIGTAIVETRRPQLNREQRRKMKRDLLDLIDQLSSSGGNRASSIDEEAEDEEDDDEGGAEEVFDEEVAPPPGG